jgi:hypothetical protein
MFKTGNGLFANSNLIYAVSVLWISIHLKILDALLLIRRR